MLFGWNLLNAFNLHPQILQKSFSVLKLDSFSLKHFLHKQGIFDTNDVRLPLCKMNKKNIILCNKVFENTRKSIYEKNIKFNRFSPIINHKTI